MIIIVAIYAAIDGLADLGILVFGEREKWSSFFVIDCDHEHGLKEQMTLTEYIESNIVHRHRHLLDFQNQKKLADKNDKFFFSFSRCE